jgi:hypothetical protein
MHERGKRFLGVAAALLDKLRQDHRVLRDRIKAAAMAAEPALVGERAGDVSRVELIQVRIERVHPAPGDRLQEGSRTGRTLIVHSHLMQGSSSPMRRCGRALSRCSQSSSPR